MDLATAHWLAGLLEGEGTFLRGMPSSPNTPVVRLVMTDRDVVDRVADIIGRRVHQARVETPGWKTPYATAIKGRPAVHLMLLLRSLMGERRQAAMDRAIAICRSADGRGRTISHVQADQLVLDRRHGCSARDLAARYGVSTSMVYKLAAGSVTIRPPVVVEPIDWSVAMADDWLAGLLEGEGAFMLRLPNGRPRPAVAIQMKDKDVVERAARLMGAKSVSASSASNPQWSPLYRAEVTDAKAKDLMLRLETKMATRRQAKIRGILAACAVPRERRGRLLSETDVRSIRSDLAKGLSIREVAAGTGVSERTVRDIRRGATWSWLA